jgi:5'-3' exoribonuclease 2
MQVEAKGGKKVSDCIRDLCEAYYRGWIWCLTYYYQGCSAWQWYYPYHYAPLASDMRNLHTFDVHFDHGKPFKPLEQLMGVLPPASAAFLPKQWRPLMCSPTSPIKDLYPDIFTIDMNGKKNPWEGIAMLAFIDETRLLGALEKAGYLQSHMHTHTLCHPLLRPFATSLLLPPPLPPNPLCLPSFFSNCASLLGTAI